VFGRRAVPKLLAYVANTRSRELFTLTVLVLALGIAVGAAAVFGVSMALGAFLAGTVVGQSEFSSRAASDALPMRDAFAVLFFVSMGMLFDPAHLMDHAWLTLATVGLVLVVKPMTAVLTLLALKHSLQSALRIGFSLGQIGEFSFIVTALGSQLGILPEAASQVLVVASLVSITLNPLLFRLIGPLLELLRKRPAADSAVPPPQRGHDRTIVVGYGPVGRIVTRVLRENDLDPVVIELNHETVNELTQQGISAVYGDASQQAILELAGAEQAVGLIFAAAGSPPEAVVRIAKQLNPKMLILARVAFLHESAELGSAGADVVITAEAEVALAMAERLLVGLGATPDQLDRERARARAELRPR
jgi:CPA2 family monovalent cation:H+ antiporter-2